MCIFHKTFCAKFSFVNTKQNVHFIPFLYLCISSRIEELLFLCKRLSLPLIRENWRFLKTI